MKGQNQCLAVISIHETVIATHDDVQQSSVNVIFQPVHVPGGAMVLFLKNTDDKQFPVLLDNQSPSPFSTQQRDSLRTTSFCNR